MSKISYEKQVTTKLIIDDVEKIHLGFLEGIKDVAIVPTEMADYPVIIFDPIDQPLNRATEHTDLFLHKLKLYSFTKELPDSTISGHFGLIQRTEETPVKGDHIKSAKYQLTQVKLDSSGDDLYYHMCLFEIWNCDKTVSKRVWVRIFTADIPLSNEVPAEIIEPIHASAITVFPSGFGYDQNLRMSIGGVQIYFRGRVYDNENMFVQLVTP